MKAMVWTHYGPPEGLHLQEVAQPTPKDQEVLIKVAATTVLAGDCELRRLQLPLWLRLSLQLRLGFSTPRKTILGQEFAGAVEAVGKAVARWQPGDQVFGLSRFGVSTYAEYLCLPAQGVLARKPAQLSYEEAAAVSVGDWKPCIFSNKPRSSGETGW